MAAPKYRHHKPDPWQFYADGKRIATVAGALTVHDAMEVAKAKSRTHRGKLIEVYRSYARLIVALDGELLSQERATTLDALDNPPAKHVGGYPDSNGRVRDFYGKATPWKIGEVVKVYRLSDSSFSDKAEAVILYDDRIRRHVAVGLSYGTGMILRASIIPSAPLAELRSEAIAESEYWLTKDREDDEAGGEEPDINPHPMQTKEYWEGESEPHGWIITKDNLHEQWAKEGIADPSDKPAVGVIGPRSVPDSIVKQLKAGKGVPFKMYDDDGTLYYSGRYIGPMDETAFAPLEDFGTPDSGATSIKYRNRDTGKWETL